MGCEGGSRMELALDRTQLRSLMFRSATRVSDQDMFNLLLYVLCVKWIHYFSNENTEKITHRKDK
jgi:hypothetical protein